MKGLLRGNPPAQFHRVNEYLKLEPEDKNDHPYHEEGKYADDEEQVIPHDWPSNGEIEFRDVTIRYDLDGPDILSSVNLKFKSGERVAVVGRTGSGKSTVSTLAGPDGHARCAGFVMLNLVLVGNFTPALHQRGLGPDPV